jgi:riboflavin kinase/FMN adenylyltransferase
MSRVWLALPAPGELGPSAVTIGNFDGVHRGHQELFHRLVALAWECAARPTVLTFDPHPARVVAPERAPRLLSSIGQRIEWIGACGVEQIVVIPFDAALARLTPEEFVEQVLVERAGARAVLVGGNFRFGHGQAGDTVLLERSGKQHGFRVEVVGPVAMRGHVISSTGVRRQIESGNVSLAARLLGRPYCLAGDVVAGHGVGKSKTVPTLNLGTEAEVLPARGVYVTRTHDVDDGRWWPSVTNVGVRPTFGGDNLSIESFLLDGYSEPPPTRIRVEFCLRLRDERKFDDAAALKEQILRDARRASSFHRRLAALRKRAVGPGKTGC